MKKYLVTVLLILAVFIPHLAHADILTNLKIYWEFNDGSGTTAVDSSGNANNGTLNNGPTWSTPGNIWPNDLLFIAANKTYVVSGTAQLTGGSKTWAVWVNPVSFPNVANMVMSGARNGQLFLTSTGDFKFLDRGANNRDSSTLIPTGTWTHLAVTCFNSGGSTDIITMYVNGSQVAQFTGLSGVCNFNLGSDFLTAGQAGASLTSAQAYDGYEQEVRYYSRALTSTDIAELYAFTAPSTASAIFRFILLGQMILNGNMIIN